MLRSNARLRNAFGSLVEQGLKHADMLDKLSVVYYVQFMLEGTQSQQPGALSAIDELENELTTLAAHLNAGNYRFLKLLGEFDRRGGYRGWGMLSCAHWLNWKCGIGLVAARDRVRVAHALEQLPKLSDAMRRGSISYCKVRAVTRIATAENEAWLLAVAENGTVSHVEKTVRLFRRVERAEELKEANERYVNRRLDYFFDDDGSFVIRGRFAPEQGTLIANALEAAQSALREAERASREASAAPDLPGDASARRADALVLVAETALAHGPTALAAGDRHLVTVHVDESVLRDAESEGRCETSAGVAVPPATGRRLCCDGSLVPIVDDERGDPIHVGRKTRAIPPALRRALDARDRGCRFPGCTNSRFVDAHHVVHWADGGETELGNLMLLCRRHHRFVHEYGFGISRDGDDVCFTRPDGRRVTDRPASRAFDDCEQLERDHRRVGLAIDHDTAPRWQGDRIDYSWVLGGLLQRSLVKRVDVADT